MNRLRIRNLASIVFDFFLLAIVMVIVAIAWVASFLPPTPPTKPHIAWLVAAILSLVMSGSAFGQHRNVCAVRQQIVAPVVAQAYVAPVKAAVVQQAYVAPQAYAVYPYQYQVGAALREEAVAEKVAQRILEQLQAKLDSLQVNGPPAPADSSLAHVQAIVNRSCVSCHAAETDPDRMDLTDISALTDPQFKAVVSQVYSGKMPKNAQPLTDEEVAYFVDAHLARPAQ